MHEQPTKEAVRFERNLHSQLTHQLALRILRGEYAPGGRLPSESVLLKEFGISRTVLREALKMLQAKGLITLKQRTGGAVQEVASWNLLDKELLQWQTEVQPLEPFLVELWEVVLMTAPTAAGLAAHRGSSEEFKEMKAALRVMKKAGGFSEEGMKACLLLYRTVMLSSHNRLLASMESAVMHALRIGLQVSALQSEDQKFDLRSHRSIANAIFSRKPVRARQLTYRLLRRTARMTKDFDSIVGPRIVGDVESLQQEADE